MELRKGAIVNISSFNMEIGTGSGCSAKNAVYILKAASSSALCARKFFDIRLWLTWISFSINCSLIFNRTATIVYHHL